tara:strand:- start:152 stop:565 length:414 start_codon:yes stop_codon:yes gene_type:complete
MEYENSARSLKSLILLICYFSLILTFKYLIAAHNFVIIFLVLIVLPLAFDIGRNKKSGIKISNKEITWFSGKFKGQIYLSDISYIEFKKRLDLSYRTELVDQNKNKILLPSEALPKINILKETLKLHGIRIVDKKFN